MPIIIPDRLPARSILEKENVFVMKEQKARTQDIRPLRIILLNLMPNKIATETQILRLLGNSPIQVELILLMVESHTSKNTSKEHLGSFYRTFSEIKDEFFDGMIITGAPVEKLPFEEVNYWNELKTIMDWTLRNVTSTLHICWGAQAGLYHHYGIPKYDLSEKAFGVFPHKIVNHNSKILHGCDELFYAPVSRHTENRVEDVLKQSDLVVESLSDESGLYLVTSKKGRQIFVTGHPEYDPTTLNDEYVRDRDAALGTKIPRNYYIDDNPEKGPLVRWRGHANLLYINWINYYVYQEMPCTSASEN